MILILGSVFANKTTTLLAEFYKYSYKRKGIMFMPSMDTRYVNDMNNPYVISHNKKLSTKATMISDVSKIYSIGKKYDLICIDELQFFAPEISEYIKKLLVLGKIVIASGLIGDYRRKPWETISKCLPLSDDLRLLKGECSECHIFPSTTSHMVQKNESGKIVESSSTKFIPLCTKCYYKKNIDL